MNASIHILAFLPLVASVDAASDAPSVPGVPFTENLGQWPDHVAFAAFARGEERRVVVRVEEGAIVVQAQDRSSGVGVRMHVEIGGRTSSV